MGFFEFLKTVFTYFSMMQPNQNRAPSNRTLSQNAVFTRAKTPPSNLSTASHSFPKSQRKGSGHGNRLRSITKLPVIMQENVPTSASQVMTNVLKIVIDQTDFQTSWAQFIKAVDNHFKFDNFVFLVPCDSQGEQLMKEGAFIMYWCKLLVKNNFFNLDFAIKIIRQNYLPKVQNQYECLQTYLKMMQNLISMKTPSKNTKNSVESLKKSRSILKNSQKKVQFGADEIIYPILEQYRKVVPPTPTPTPVKKQKTRQQKLIELKSKNCYLIDHFQINDFFFLQDVEIVGIIRQYEGIYEIIQVKQKKTEKQYTCIAIKNESSIAIHPESTLKQISKDFENLGFLDLEGKQSGSLWVDSLPETSIQQTNFV